MKPSRIEEERRFAREFARQIDDPRLLEYKCRTWVIRRLIRLLKLRHDAALLDLGCGSGYLVSQVRDIVCEGLLAGIDISEDMIKMARRKEELKACDFVVGDIVTQALPERWQGTFDYATATFSLHHWLSIRTLEKVLDTLKPGGKFYAVDASAPDVLVPFLNKLAIRRSGSVVNAGYIETGLLLEMFQDAGFADINQTYLAPMILLTVATRISEECFRPMRFSSAEPQPGALPLREG